MAKRICLVLLMLTVSTISHADSKAWLYGDWEMAYDPDGDSKDVLTFSEGGGFRTTEASTGKTIEGMYQVGSSAIDIRLVHQGRIFMTLRLDYDSEKNKLYYNPEKTGDPAYYMRLR